MRGWHEWVGLVGDIVPVPLLGIGLTLVVTIAAMLWYFWPDWLPRRRTDRHGGAGTRRGRGALRWPRLRQVLARLRRLLYPRMWRLRWRWRWRLRWRRRRGEAQSMADLPDDALPDLPASVLVLTADELAAQGRYREAVRERLRAIVRDLVEREVVDYRPGWTVTELAGMAGAARPAAAAPLRAASDVFSGIWYGRQPSGPAEDAAMREYATEVKAAVGADTPGVSGARSPGGPRPASEPAPDPRSTPAPDSQRVSG